MKTDPLAKGTNWRLKGAGQNVHVHNMKTDPLAKDTKLEAKRYRSTVCTCINMKTDPLAKGMNWRLKGTGQQFARA